MAPFNTLQRLAYYERNKEKIKARSRKWHAKRSIDSRKQLYGMTEEQYNELLAAQEGTCAICDQGSGRWSLSVDHDHKTGEIRGLLCHRCNMGIGSFEDNPNLLSRAIEYLEE